MTKLMVLKILLSFCGDVDYELTCEYEMITCYESKIEKNFNEEFSFKECLNQNFIKIYEGDYGEARNRF